MNKNLLYRNIPKVDILLENEKIQELIEAYGRETVVETIREKLEMLREYIKECEEEEKAFAKISSLVSDIEREVIRINTPDIRSVINGTGTILHTNLGRSNQSETYAVCGGDCHRLLKFRVQFGRG